MTPTLAGKKVAVYGLAKSGLAAIRLCQREGAKVTAVDKASRAQLGQTAEALAQQGVTLHLGEDAAAVLSQSDLVVVSPGVPLAVPELQAAQRSGVPVWGEIELASRFLPEAPFIGITGTNGKSTTTALCGALFAAAGKRPFVGGNLGLPLSDAALARGEHDSFVIELSSFQLEGAQTLRCTGAALLNLTPDHIDRYESHAAYGDAKARIFRNQQPGDFAVTNADDPAVRELSKRAQVPVYGFTLRSKAEAARDASGALAGLAIAEGGGFVLDVAGQPQERFFVRSRALRGAHNLQNAMAAALLARRSGVGAEDIQRGLDEYPGLPHRIESVATVGGVEWINDSKATNVDSTLVALNAFTSGVWLILGGKGKGASYAPLVAASRGRVKGVLTVGQDAPAIAAAYKGVLPVEACETLERAVSRARERAVAGDVVLLSPACASLDQFKNFEHRGDVFKSLVRGMTE